jgi:hypothetical protein
MLIVVVPVTVNATVTTLELFGGAIPSLLRSPVKIKKKIKFSMVMVMVIVQ